MDWNNDGRIDILTGGHDGRLRIYLNTGSAGAPNFGTPSTLRVGGSVFVASGGISKPYVADWNNDGRKDIVCGNDNGTVQLLLNTGLDAAPGFSVATFVQSGTGRLDVGDRSNPVVVDLNADGGKDLVVGEQDGGLFYFENVGTDANPAFNGSEPLMADGIAIDVGAHARPDMADLNGDGSFDLVVGSNRLTGGRWHGYVYAFYGPPPGFPEIEVRGAGELIVDGDTTAGLADNTSFGAAVQGAPAVTRTFRVHNTGTAALTTAAMTVPGGFTIVEGLAASIAPGAYDDFTVALTTSQCGLFMGDVTFANNDTDGGDGVENPFSFRIAGTVIGPEAAVSGGGLQILDGDTTPGPADGTDFGAAAWDDPPVARTFRLSNVGTGALAIMNLTVPTGFTVVEGLAPSLEAGQYDEFTIVLDADAPGTHAGEVRFFCDDADESLYTFRITGVVIAPAVSVTGRGRMIADGDDTPHTSDGTDFATATEGGPGVEWAFTVANRGNAPLALGEVAVPEGFTLVEGLAGSLAPDACDTFTVRLDTSEVGIRQGEVRFDTDDPAVGAFTFAITGAVLGVNHPPAAAADDAATDEDAAVRIAVLPNDDDVDGDPLEIAALGSPAHGSVVDNGDGTVTYTPAADYHGSDSFTYTVSDGRDGTGQATVTVTVAPVNDPPAATDDAAEVNENGSAAVPVLANDSDVDGDALSIAAVTAPSHGTAVDNGDGTITYTPDADYVGPDAFSYTIDDGAGRQDTAVVTLDVHARFSDPILIAGSLCFTDADGTAVTLRVLQGSVSVVMAGRDILQTSRKGVTYVVGQDLLMESVELVDSTARTTVVITARGGADGVTTLGRLTGDQPANAFVAPGVDLVGQGVAMGGQGCFNTIRLRDLAAGAAIRMDGQAAGRGITITARNLQGDNAVQAASPIALLKAAAWPGGSLTAPCAANVQTTGDRRLDLRGDFGAAVTLTGQDAGGRSLAALQIAGAATGLTIDAAGGVNMVSAKQWNGGSLRARWLGRLIVQANPSVAGLDGDLAADVMLTSQDTRGRSATLIQVAGAIGEGRTIDLAAGADRILFGRWTDGALTGRWARVIQATGNRQRGLSGDFGATVTLQGDPQKRYALEQLAVAGDLTGAAITVLDGAARLVSVVGTACDSRVAASGGLDQVSVGAARGSDFLAGLNADFVSALDAGGDRRPAHGDYAAPEATVRSFVVRGLRGAAGRFFEDSTIAAGRIGTVRLLNGDFADGRSAITACDGAGEKEILLVIHTDTQSKAACWRWPAAVFVGPTDLVRIV